MHQTARVRELYIEKKLKIVNDKINNPQILIGDINVVIYNHEKRRGNLILFKKLELINNFILKIGLVKPIISGNKAYMKFREI